MSVSWYWVYDAIALLSLVHLSFENTSTSPRSRGTL